MNNSSATQSEGSVRAIGTRALGLNIINMVVGGGIFVLPGVIAAKLGPAAIIAYLICSIAVALFFLCFAEIGSRVTRSGGAYAYIEEAFGPFAGFVASMPELEEFKSVMVIVCGGVATSVEQLQEWSNEYL